MCRRLSSTCFCCAMRSGCWQSYDRRSRVCFFSAVLALQIWRHFGITCDVGDTIEAIFSGTGAFHTATIVSIDLSSSPLPIITVDWDDGSPSFRHVLRTDTKKAGDVCVFLANAGQSFSAIAEAPTTLRLVGVDLSEACRLLVIDPSETCGLLSATLHSSVSSPPGTPIGSVDMFFFDVIVTVSGSYTLCFWSGQSINNLTEFDVSSYATTIGPLSVDEPPTPTTTTTTGMTIYSRRRGHVYEVTVVRIEGSNGVVYEGITANPAAWNVHLPSMQHATCRTCQRYSLADVDLNVRELQINRIAGAIRPALGLSQGVLGIGCGETDMVAPQSPDELLLVSRGGCTYVEKAYFASSRGYRGVLVVDHQTNVGRSLPDMAAAGGGMVEMTVPVPAWIVPQDEGEALFTLLATDPMVTLAIEDVLRKPRMSSALSDSFGTRRYEIS